MNDESLKRTQTFFKDKYSMDISPEEAKEINKRITNYFRILAKWKRREDEMDKDSKEQ